MVRVFVDQPIKQIKSNFKNLDTENVAKACYNAINRTLTKGRTTARQSVKDVYNISQKNLDGIVKENATKNLLIGYIKASTKPIPMDAFGPKFQTVYGSISISRRGVQKTKDFKKKKATAIQGVSIEVIKGKREIVPYAFMIRNAKPRVFARGMYKTGGSWGFIQRHKRENATGNDTPIKPLVSVTVHGAVINNQVENRLANDISAYFPARFEHEINFQLSKMQSQTTI